MPPEDTGAETSTGSSIESQLSAAFGGETSTESSATTAPATAPATVSGEQNADSGTTVSLEAPKHWTDVDKGLFAKAPRDIQQRWLDRETETARSYDSKYQELAAFRRERDQLEELFKPFSRDLELAGGNRLQLIQSLLGAHKYIQEDPRAAFQWIAQQYGVDLGELLKPAETDTDPRYSKLTQELNAMRGQLNGFVRQSQTSQQEANLSRVSSFAEAKGEDGKPLHPYFDEVANDILVLMKGGEKDLEKAYSRALRMNDAVWEKVQAEKASTTQAADDAKRKADVEKARRAAVGNEGSGTQRSAKPKTLDEELHSQFEGWRGGN